MTRMDGVRAATGTAKDSVLHAADVVAPYAGAAREQAALYAHEARVKMAPKVSKAAHQAGRQARAQYAVLVAPHVPPKLDDAAHRAVHQTRLAARHAAEYAAPRVEHAVAAAGPLRDEAVARSAAALAALRGQVTAKELKKLVRKHERRAKARRTAKGVAVTGLVLGGAVAAWKWWERQSAPDWLVEPPEPTEVAERSPLASVDGSGPSSPGREAEPGAAENGDDSDRRS
ncbi:MULTISPECIES: DUF5324 family protein [unclassified Streptomyces]|uniref:DUF5324 family protein n=1 Tax=unclassified Streptomyces TaxID=2593676 RepID=UPI0008DDC10C|nr:MULTISPECIES: DUF5324 family protein [unclassified Streptomyces]OII68138.1 transcriptional regulator [Streptomyces sp. CC77]